MGPIADIPVGGELETGHPVGVEEDNTRLRARVVRQAHHSSDHVHGKLPSSSLAAGKTQAEFAAWVLGCRGQFVLNNDGVHTSAQHSCSP